MAPKASKICTSVAENVNSQTAQVRERKRKGLHPVNELRRFGILVCCFFCSACVSLTFAFELLSSQFREQFLLSPGDMSTISTVGLAFCYFSLPYSFIYESFGPTINFLICGTTGFIGALGLGLTFQQKMGGNLASITVFYTLMNIAAGLFDVSYVSTLFEVFPRNRGPVVGLAKVMAGLGASIFSCLCDTLFNDDVASFVYFISVFVVVVALSGACVVRLPPYHLNYWRRRNKSQEELALLTETRSYYNEKFVPKPRLIAGYVVVIAMLVFYAVEAPVIAYTPNVTRGGKIAVGVIAVLLLLCLFIPVLPIRALGGMYEKAPAKYLEDEDENDDDNNAAESAGDSDSTAVETAGALGSPTEKLRGNDLLNTVQDAEPLEDDLEMSPRSQREDSSEDAAAKQKIEDTSSSAEESSSLEKGPASCERALSECEEVAESRQDPRYTAVRWYGYLKRVELWLLLGYLFLVQPMGIMVAFNSSTLSIALTNVERTNGLSVLYSAFLGVGNSVGRLLFGLFEGYVQHQDPANRKVLVTVSMFFVPVVGSIAGILVQVVPGNAILLPFILIFIQAGFTSSLAALMFSSLFEKFHNALYCTGCFTFVADVILFNRVLLGVWADKQHAKLGLDDTQECNEPVCVRMPLIVVTCMCAASSGLAAILHIRYSRFVRRERASARALRDAYLDAAARDADELEGIQRSTEHSVNRSRAKLDADAVGDSD